MPANRVYRTAAAVVIWSLAVGGVAAGLRVAWAATHSPGQATITAQVAALQAAVDDGLAEQAQTQFPEGFAFTHLLVGLSVAQTAAAGDPEAVRGVSRSLAALDSPVGRAPFAGTTNPPDGIFWSGWSLLLATELARLSGTADDREAVRTRATRVLVAIRDSPHGWCESYPGQVWPVDTVVALAALARADRLVAVPGARPVVEGWTARTAGVRDDATGLLPHRLSGPGVPGTPPIAVEGVRATSQSVIAVFAPDIDPGRAAEDYRRSIEHFVTRRAGLAATVEYPAGTPGAGDVDSGPLLLGVSLSATVVTLAAARRQGDRDLARALDRQAELFGFPVTWHGKRRYAGGVVPIGEAFLAWARTQPLGGPDPLASTPRPWWWAWALAPLVAVAPLAWRLRSRPRRSRPRP